MMKHTSKFTLTVLAAAASLMLAPMILVAVGAESKLAQDQKIVHLLNRISYGPRPGDVERVKRIGVNEYIEQQLHPERIDDSATEARLASLDSLRMSIAKVFDRYPQPNRVAIKLGLFRPGAQPQESESKLNQEEMRRQIIAYYNEQGLKLPQRLLQELQAQKIIRAVYSERQLQEVMADFWFNHFNVYWGKGADKWLTTDFEMNAIRPHALGKFRDLLMATAKSPAMLVYLDNYLSSSPDAKIPRRMRRDDTPQIANQLRRRKLGINENYARELLELHTMGVDGGYTQKDVQEVARCFTGWTIERPERGGGFAFREWMHDDGEKVVLGHKIPARGGIKDGEMVIDILARHPSTARFIATKLVRRFISDDPPKALVNRVADVYLKTDGDIRKMLRTIFTSREFYSPQAYRAKVKSPFELVVSAVRALGGDTDGSARLAQLIARMGQPLYQCSPPTGYPDRADQWVNTGTMIERLNFGLALVANRIPGTTVDLKGVTEGIDSTKPDQVLERAIAVLLGGNVSPETRAALYKRLKGELGDRLTTERELTGELDAKTSQQPVNLQVARAFALVLGSPEFQRR